MPRSTSILAALVLAGIFLFGCRSDSPTDLQSNPSSVAPDAGKPQPRIADRDEDDDDDDDNDDRNGGSDRDGANASNALPRLPSASDFVSQVDNPYLAYEVGKIFHYQQETAEGTETNTVEITNGTKVVMGVTTTVVRDRVFLDGELTEDTLDYVAQDSHGNVWYFGEDAKQYENGQLIGTEGSWLAGEDGAKPGILMLAHPEVGLRYAQERAPDVAEDRARVISLDASAEVEYGEFHHCLETKETTPLEPGVSEYKFYKKNVGLLLEAENRNGGGDRNELVSVEP